MELISYVHSTVFWQLFFSSKYSFCHIPIKNIFCLLKYICSGFFFLGTSFPSFLSSYSSMDWFAIGWLSAYFPGISLWSHLGSHITVCWILCWIPCVLDSLFPSVLIIPCFTGAHFPGNGLKNYASLKLPLFDKVWYSTLKLIFAVLKIVLYCLLNYSVAFKSIDIVWYIVHYQF